MRSLSVLVLIGVLAVVCGRNLKDLEAQLREIIDLVGRDEIVEKPNTDCAIEADIAFILDASSSIAPEDYERMQVFVKKMIRSFDVSLEKVRIAIVSFNRWARVDLYLDQSKGTYAATKAVDNIMATGTGTFTNRALAMARNSVFVPSVGDRSDVPNIAIVLTDGRSNAGEETTIEARKLRASGVMVFSIGVGRWVSDEELQVIATKPSSEFAFRLESFDGLTDIQDVLRKKTCKNIIEPPKPIPECEPAVFDITFILDASSSISPEGFEEMKTFVDIFISSFEISPKFTRFAVITFNLYSQLVFDLQSFNSYFPMKTAVANLEQGQAGTSTNKALDLARTDVFSVEREDNTEPMKAAIVLTDGKSREPELTEIAAKQLKDAGVIIFTIGVGKTRITELETIASEPTDTHNFQVEDFGDLKSIFYDLYKETCKDVPDNKNIFPPEPVEPATTVDVCNGVADVFFLMEIPKKDEDFNILSKYLKGVISRLTVAESGIRVAISLYAKTTFPVARFDDFQTAKELKKALETFDLPDNRDTSYKKAFGDFEYLKNLGWRRNGVPKVIVSGLIDNPKDSVKPDVLSLITKLRNASFTSIVLNIGMPWEEGTMALASKPKERNGIYVPRMDALKNTVTAVVAQICSGASTEFNL